MSSSLPDFASLYKRSLVGPRMAARLWVVCPARFRHFQQSTPEMWLEELPLVAQPYVDDQFTAEFGSRFNMLAMRLGAGLEAETGIVSCTADEVALHMVIDHAEALHDDGQLDWEWILALPERPGDFDYRGVKEILFLDLDVLCLYDPSMDGAEGPESEIAQLERFVNLHPRDWFKTFTK